MINRTVQIQLLLGRMLTYCRVTVCQSAMGMTPAYIKTRSAVGNTSAVTGLWCVQGIFFLSDNRILLFVIGISYELSSGDDTPSKKDQRALAEVKPTSIFQIAGSKCQ